MNTVAILPVPDDCGRIDYHAVAGPFHSQGATAGQALDSLTSQLSGRDTTTFLVVLRHEPDQDFGEDQQRRLGELMSSWRTSRDNGVSLPQSQADELQRLVELEIQATASRAARLATEADR